jgi:putative rmuC protein
MRRKMETLIVIMVSVLLIITVLILFQLFKIRKQQQLELLYLKEEMEQLMIKEFTSGTEKSINENARRLVEIEKTTTLNIKNNLLQGIGELNNALSGNNEKLLMKFNDFIQKIGVVMNENNQGLTLNINRFKDEFKKSVNDDFEALNRKIEGRLDLMNAKVEERLAKGFEETTKTFGSVLERLGKIDEAQKKIEALSSNVVSLQDILTDKKNRGIFGEVQLYQILASVFGEKNDRTYQKQYKLSNNTMVDAMLFTPEPIGNIAIDSKFPLENYRKMYDSELTNEERINARKEFVGNLKKHIDDISEKYIIRNETSDQAIMFLPAEAIFAEINAYHTDVIDYAYRKNVRIASPTTLVSVLTTIQMILTNIEREKYASVIQEELGKLHEEFGRYEKRWKALEKDIEKVTKDVKEITTTSNKISKRFTEISNVNMIKQIENEESEIADREG